MPIDAEVRAAGVIVSIVFTPRALAGRPQSHYVRKPAETVILLADRGIEGDSKARPGKRQINVMCEEVLNVLAGEGLRTAPGEMGEQIVIRGIDPDRLQPGARIRLGEAMLEVTIPRTGCERFEMIQGKQRESVAGRLGVLCRVVGGGSIRLGDPVRLLSE